ncbi:hypothetical protein AC578_6250 [Pseudocercospora eumusae]|uniref:Uncharacterized protein n=1 Tax=Pseudocercospora eumusae TaxID=321146 RepID=A0A139GZR5_9PEZI|nr:hypothetical protein AC578_6250 [Pseudocercospora eumusae]
MKVLDLRPDGWASRSLDGCHPHRLATIVVRLRHSTWSGCPREPSAPHILRKHFKIIKKHTHSTAKYGRALATASEGDIRVMSVAPHRVEQSSPFPGHTYACDVNPLRAYNRVQAQKAKEAREALELTAERPSTSFKTLATETSSSQQNSFFDAAFFGDEEGEKKTS